MTLSQLRRQCRLFLASETSWTDAMLEGFINDGIRAYSNEFPRRLRHTLSLTTGVQRYALPGGHGFMRLLSVEYPAGQQPPCYLTQVEPWDPDLFARDDVYTLHPVDDDLDANADQVLGHIVFGRTVVTGEEAILTYEAVHTILANDDDVGTVPAAHLEAIIAFVDFRAHWEAESDGAYSAASSSLILSQLGENGRRAWNCWREVMGRLAPVGGWQKANPVWGEIGL
jgi:hypothetical protein